MRTTSLEPHYAGRLRGPSGWRRHVGGHARRENRFARREGQLESASPTLFWTYDVTTSESRRRHCLPKTNQRARCGRTSVGRACPPSESPRQHQHLSAQRQPRAAHGAGYNRRKSCRGCKRYALFLDVSDKGRLHCQALHAQTDSKAQQKIYARACRSNENEERSV